MKQTDTIFLVNSVVASIIWSSLIFHTTNPFSFCIQTGYGRIAPLRHSEVSNSQPKCMQNWITFSHACANSAIKVPEFLFCQEIYQLCLYLQPQTHVPHMYSSSKFSLKISLPAVLLQLVLCLYQKSAKQLQSYHFLMVHPGCTSTEEAYRTNED